MPRAAGSGPGKHPYCTPWGIACQQAARCPPGKAGREGKRATRGRQAGDESVTHGGNAGRQPAGEKATAQQRRACCASPASPLPLPRSEPLLPRRFAPCCCAPHGCCWIAPLPRVCRCCRVGISLPRAAPSARCSRCAVGPEEAHLVLCRDMVYNFLLLLA